MAGDWMKIELELPDKPEVHAIAGMLNLDSDAVVGKLIRVWQWFDKHTKDGNAYGVTKSLLDRITSVTEFADAMVSVGWLEEKNKCLCMPKFDRHTSESAKKRATTQKRVQKSRNAVTVTKVLPEKRREEKRKSPTHFPLDEAIYIGDLKEAESYKSVKSGESDIAEEF
jgi:DNA replication protein DnaT